MDGRSSSRRKPARAYKGKLDDDAQLRRALWRTGFVVVCLLGAVFLSYWLTYRTSSKSYSIKDKSFK
ncbi:hypothetical protein WJX84_007283, partial [Apatococcus fuscideae]